MRDLDKKELLEIDGGRSPFDILIDFINDLLGEEEETYGNCLGQG